MRKSPLAISVALTTCILVATVTLAWVGVYPPVGHIESDIPNASYGYYQDGVGFVSSTAALDTVMGMVDNHSMSSQAAADAVGLVYEIYLVEDRNGDGVFNAYDDTPAQTWTLAIRVVCDGLPGHAIGWDGNEGNLLQAGSTIALNAGRCYLLKLRVVDGTGNTSTEVGGSDVWYTSGASSYLSRDGDAAQALSDNEVLWIRVPMKPPPNVGGGIGTLPTNTDTSTTTSNTTTSTTTTLPGVTTTTTSTTTTTLPPGDPALLSTGAGMEQCNGNYYELGTYAGQPSYKHFCTAPVGPNHDRVVWIWWGFDNKWRMGNCPGGAVVYYWSFASAWPEAPILWPWYAIGPYGIAPTPSTYFWTP